MVLAGAFLSPVGAGAADPAAGQGAGERFDVLELRVLGNTVVEPAAVERTLYPFLGKDKVLADVESARDALVKLYRERGYGTVSVDIPEQSVEGGVVRLKVVEGTLDRVAVEGARYFSHRQIRAGVPELASGKVPDLNALQAQLTRLAGQSADRTIVPVLRAGREPGLVDATLKVDDHVPVHASVDVNDRYTADTSRTRVSATLSYDYLFGRPQSLALQYQTAPSAPSEVRAWGLSWVDRDPGGLPGSWSAYFVDSNSDVAALGAVAVLGKGRIAGLRRSFVLAARQDETLYASVGADYKSFLENILVETGPPARTPIHYLTTVASLGGSRNAGHWRFEGSSTLTFELSQVVNSEDDFAFKRYRAHASFVTLRGDARLGYVLPADFSLGLKLAAQRAGAPVVSNEQFSLGGIDTVRGYLEAELLADNALSGSLEFATPRIHLLGQGTGATSVQWLVFGDAGVGSIEEALPGQRRRTTLASWGTGLSFAGPYGSAAQLDWARTLRAGTRTPRDASRVHFDVRWAF
jgi:hemolysin activation/secretion protein